MDHKDFVSASLVVEGKSIQQVNATILFIWFLLWFMDSCSFRSLDLNLKKNDINSRKERDNWKLKNQKERENLKRIYPTFNRWSKFRRKWNERKNLNQRHRKGNRGFIKLKGIFNSCMNFESNVKSASQNINLNLSWTNAFATLLSNYKKEQSLFYENQPCQDIIYIDLFIS